MDLEQVKELLLQALEVELGGVKVYEAAIQCAVNEDLKEEWEKYHQQTERHVQILQEVLAQMQLDPDEDSPGRDIQKALAQTLVKSMKQALGAGKPEAAQLVACECVTIAEMKDHLDWELITQVGKRLSGAEGKALRSAAEEVEDEEDEHLYHTRGWMRELWLESLGMKAMLPPPEEKKHVHTAVAAARVQEQRSRPH